MPGLADMRATLRVRDATMQGLRMPWNHPNEIA
jgi:hypothetical protein